MISFLSLITLFLRLSLAIQGQLGVFTDLASTGDQLHCKSLSAPQESIHSDDSWFDGNISLTRKLENEERVEVEGERLLDLSLGFSFYPIAKAFRLVSNSVFGTKAIRGSLPPLYDFFHSWKIHLS
jgi:hypothetical protein